MEVRHVRYFLAVAEELNFTRAAERLGIAQPPLSQQIKDLEAETGTRLFKRLSRGVELTEAGRAFREQVSGVEDQLKRATMAAQRAMRGETGSVRVGISGAAVLSPHISQTIRGFRNAYPEARLDVEERHSGQLVEALRCGELDVAFMRYRGDGRDARLSIQVLAEEPLVAALPSSHAAATDRQVNLGMLRDDPFVLFPAFTGPLFDIVMEACRDVGFEPRLGPEAVHIGSIINLVAAECGVSLIPASFGRLQVDGVAFRDLGGDPPLISLVLAHRRGDTARPVRNFILLANEASGRPVRTNSAEA